VTRLAPGRPQPHVPLLCRFEDDRHGLAVDRPHDVVRLGREEGIELVVERSLVLATRAVPARPQPGEEAERHRLLEGEPGVAAGAVPELRRFGEGVAPKSDVLTVRELPVSAAGIPACLTHAAAACDIAYRQETWSPAALGTAGHDPGCHSRRFFPVGLARPWGTPRTGACRNTFCYTLSPRPLE
jgi:hypothetical protein